MKPQDGTIDMRRRASNPETLFTLHAAWLVALIAALVLVAIPASAALSSDELRELADKGVSSDVILSLITKHCVDFDLDKRTRKAWADKLETEAVDAILACRGITREAGVSPVGKPAMAERTQMVRQAAPPPKGTARYAVVPLTVDGKVDLEVTSLFLDQLREHVKPAEVVDPFTLGMHFGDPDNFNAGATEESLVAAASKAGATAIVVAKAYAYKQFEDYAVRIDAKLVDVEAGGHLWSESGRGTNGNRSWASAKKRAVTDLLRKVPADAAPTH